MLRRNTRAAFMRLETPQPQTDCVTAVHANPNHINMAPTEEPELELRSSTLDPALLHHVLKLD